MCTDSYTVSDVIKLINVLFIRYQLDCTLRFHRPAQPRIYIRQGSMSKLRSIVQPHMHPSFLYKLGKISGVPFGATGALNRNKKNIAVMVLDEKGG